MNYSPKDLSKRDFFIKVCESSFYPRLPVRDRSSSNKHPFEVASDLRLRITGYWRRNEEKSLGPACIVLVTLSPCLQPGAFLPLRRICPAPNGRKGLVEHPFLSLVYTTVRPLDKRTDSQRRLTHERKQKRSL